jgi:hypothetical protein
MTQARRDIFDRAPEVFRGLRIVERLGAIDLGDVTPPSYRDYVRPATAREEAYLERRFGDDYRAYKSRVRRWLWETPSSRVVAVARKENIP